MTQKKRKRVGGRGSSGSRAQDSVPSQPQGFTPRRALIAILLLALLFKSAYLFAYAGHSPFYLAPAADSEVYVMQTLEMSEEGLLGDEVFYRAPFYRYFLYAIFSLSSFEPLPLHVIQLLLGLGILALLYSIASRISTPRAGLIAACIGLAYAPMTFYETKILATVPGMFLGLLFIHYLVRAEQESEQGERGRRRDWVLGGGALGLAILCRPHYLLVFPLALAAWLYRYRANWRGLRTHWLTFSLIVVGVVSLATARNYAISGDFIPISANSGVTFAQGNAPGARGGLTPIPGLSNDVAMQHINAHQLAEAKLGRSLSPSEANSYWVGRGVEFILDNPGAYLWLLVRKAALIVNNYEPASNYLVDIDLQMFPWLRLAFLPFGLILACAIAGIVAQERERSIPLIVYATMLGTVGTMLLFYITTRYRMNLAPAVILLAGVGVDHFLRSWRDRKATLRNAAIVLGVFVLSLSPFLPSEQQQRDRTTAASWANLAVAFHLADRIPEAAEAITTATRLAPNDGSYQMMHFDLALRPSLDSAAQELEQAEKLVTAFPGQAGGYRRVAEALVKLARPREAIGRFERTLAQEPGDVHAMLGLARAYETLGRQDAARQLLQRLLSIAPHHERAAELLQRLQPLQ